MGKNIDDLYPIKPAAEMPVEEFSRWWALMDALEIIFDHAERYDIDIDRINFSNKKIIEEYIEPISGDIMHKIEQAGGADEIYSW